MALIIKFRKQRKFTKTPPWTNIRRRRKRRVFQSLRHWKLVMIVMAVGVVGGAKLFDGYEIGASAGGEDHVVSCVSPVVIDGDTFTCSGLRIRLASIDAPEMPGHCRKGRRCTSGDPFGSRDYLRSLVNGPVTCHPIDTDHYGRTVARCEADGKDLSCEMVGAGHAVKRYGFLLCL